MAVQAKNGNLESTTCTVYFPFLFEQLRELVVGNSTFVEALRDSRSVELTGGKVGDFLKTQDDRFIIKVIKKVEAQAFGEHAKEYVEYVFKRAANEEEPLVLAKILGFFRIKHSHFHRSQYIIVMENLFPSHRFGHIDRVFDLKGCTYGRRQQEEGATGFERNLAEYTTDGSPLLLTPAAKALFRQAVSQDTYFLEQLQVVDYSLLLGVDTVSKQLVVGIVDYCREYSLGLAMYGGVTGGRTIVAPKAYRKRFCEQMDRFLMGVTADGEEMLMEE